MINNRIVGSAARFLVFTLFMGCGAADEAETEQQGSSQRIENPGIAVAITLPDRAKATFAIGRETGGILSSEEQGADYQVSVVPSKDGKFAFTIFEASGVSRVETFEMTTHEKAIKTSVPLRFELVTDAQTHELDLAPMPVVPHQGCCVVTARCTACAPVFACCDGVCCFPN